MCVRTKSKNTLLLKKESPVRYYQWQKNERLEKLEVVATVGDAFSELKKQLKPFLIHTFEQSTHFDALVKSSDHKNVVLQVDFSEKMLQFAVSERFNPHIGHTLRQPFLPPTHG